MKKGRFIVIEGIDGSGKATQTDLLARRLKKEGRKVKKVEFPRYNKESSVLIREYLAGKFGSLKEVGPYRASIFYAIDRYAESFNIRKWLKEGCVVIADRYVSSNKGHQASKITSKKERMKFLLWVNRLEYETLDIPVPDLTIYLHLPHKIAFENIKSRSRETGQKRDLHEKLKNLKASEESYLEMSTWDPYENWHVVNGAKEGENRTRQEIAEEIYGLLH